MILRNFLSRSINLQFILTTKRKTFDASCFQVYLVHLYTFCCSVPTGKCATRLSGKASGGQLCSTSTDLSVAVYLLSLNESLKAIDNFIQDFAANCVVILLRNLTFQ